MTRALSGKPVDSLTVEAVRAGELSVADLRIHPDTLEFQAQVAAEHGNPQLAELAASLAARKLPRCAALVTEAADVYARRGLSG